MAVKNRAHFKDIFKSGYKIKEEDYVDWLDSFRHKEDPVQLSDAEGLEAFLQPYRRNDETIPVAEVDGIGDVISGYLENYLTSSSTIEKSQVEGLEDELSSFLKSEDIEDVVQGIVDDTYYHNDGVMNYDKVQQSFNIGGFLGINHLIGDGEYASGFGDLQKQEGFYSVKIVDGDKYGFKNNMIANVENIFRAPTNRVQCCLDASVYSEFYTDAEGRFRITTDTTDFKLSSVDASEIASLDDLKLFLMDIGLLTKGGK